MNRETVYAYYDPPSIQTMEEHVKLALEAFGEKGILVRFGQSLSPAFYTLLKLGLLFHDFGKVLFSPRDGKLSFTGHEVVSGWVVYRLLESREGGKILDKLGVKKRSIQNERSIQNGALVLAVMLHHHPMDFPSRLKKFRERVEKGSWCRLTTNHVKAFVASVATPAYEHLSLDSNELENFLVEALGTSEARCLDICSATKRIYEDLLWKNVWREGTVFSRRLFLLLLQGIVAADYKASQPRSRGVPVSMFAHAIKIFLRHYSGVSRPSSA